MKNLYIDAKNIEETNDLFTKCLIHLEKGQIKLAKEHIEKCYSLTDSIEQRLALCFLFEMTKKSSKDIKIILDNVYNV